MDIQSIDKLSKDLRAAAGTLSEKEARFLVDTYYMMQDQRIRSSNQLRSMAEEPHAVLGFFENQFSMLEKQVAIALAKYAESHVMWPWFDSVKGIGPVLTAGLLAHIDITRCQTAGHIWSFAGLTDDAVWLGKAAATKVITALCGSGDKIVTHEQLLEISKNAGCSPKWLARRLRRAITSEDIPFHGWDAISDAEYVSRVLDGIQPKMKALITVLSKRPWNAELKTLCFKIGESFVKVSGRDDAYYGKLYRQHKDLLIARNNEGQFAAAAAECLPRFGASTESHKHYAAGHLPPAHIHARARRYAVKIFLAHTFEIWYPLANGGKAPPKPYAIGILGHAHYIPPPFPIKSGETAAA